MGTRAKRGPVRSRAEAHAAGKALREKCPRDAHAAWAPPAVRRDAVETVLAADLASTPSAGVYVQCCGDAHLSNFAAFAVAYADQNERDHAALQRAVRRGKVKAVFEEQP